LNKSALIGRFLGLKINPLRESYAKLAMIYNLSCTR